MRSVQKDEEENNEEIKQIFARLYLGIDWHDLLQIWNVDLLT